MQQIAAGISEAETIPLNPGESLPIRHDEFLLPQGRLQVKIRKKQSSLVEKRAGGRPSRHQGGSGHAESNRRYITGRE